MIKKTGNKKGAIVLQLLAMGLVIFLLFVLLMTVISGPDMKLIGETQKNIVNAFEAGQRTFFYIDAATDISAKIALNKTISFGGYAFDFVEGNKVYPDCGYVISPVINKDSKTFCIPNYKETLKYNFKIQFTNLLKKYDLFQINSKEFETIIDTDGADIVIRTVGLSDINIPIYAFVQSYYSGINHATDSQNTEYKKDTSGYLERDGLQSENRQGYTSDKIVIFDTFTKDVSETYSQLYASGRNYNYVIDREGKIYKFADESRATKSLYCTEKNCAKDIDEKQIISIGMQSCSKNSAECQVVACYTGSGLKHTDACWDQYTQDQIVSLDNLLADIAIRNTGIIISDKTVLGYDEIDKTAKNPTPFFSDNKASTIKDANIFIQNRLKGNTKKTDSKAPAIQGNALAPPSPNDLLKNNPTYQSGIITATVYYTPDCNDPTLKRNGWSSGAINSKGYCYIPESQRGFYEEVKCQGSGSCNKKIYNHVTITKDQATSPYITGLKNGKTATGTDPVAHRTAAVNPQPGTQCYIKYGTQFYAYFGEGNSWNGFYVAEDTGSAFKGKCKIDFYAGVGENNKDAATKFVNPKTSPEIYVLDANYDVAQPVWGLNSDSGAYAPLAITGSYTTKYASKTILNGAVDFFQKGYADLQSAVKSCYAKGGSRTEKESCLNVEFSKVTDLTIKTGVACYEINPISFAEIKNSNNVQDVAGILEKKSEIISTPLPDTKGRVTTKSAIITLKNNNEELEVTLYGPAVKKLDSMNVDDYILLKNTQRALVGGIQIDKRAIYSDSQIILNPANTEMKYLADFAQKLADCATDKSICECDVKYEGRQNYLNFKQNQISLGDFTDADTVEISNKISYKPQKNTLISDSLKYSIPANGEILFDKTKEGDFTIIDKTNKHAACVPKQNYFNVCISSKEASLKGLVLQDAVKI